MNHSHRKYLILHFNAHVSIFVKNFLANRATFIIRALQVYVKEDELRGIVFALQFPLEH